jgi:hypothetical protein
MWFCNRMIHVPHLITCIDPSGLEERVVIAKGEIPMGDGETGGQGRGSKCLYVRQGGDGCVCVCLGVAKGQGRG